MPERIFTIGQEQDIIECYKGGESALALSKRLGVAHTTIRTLLKRAKVPVQPQFAKSTPGVGGSLTPDQKLAILNRHNEGMSERAIAKATGIARTTVQRTIQRATEESKMWR